MIKNVLISFALAAATFEAAHSADAAVDSGTRKEVLARVQSLGADIKWNAKAIEALEFNCDGEEDYVIGGRADNRYYIAIIVGPLSRMASPLTADFPIGRTRTERSARRPRSSSSAAWTTIRWKCSERPPRASSSPDVQRGRSRR